LQQEERMVQEEGTSYKKDAHDSKHESIKKIEHFIDSLDESSSEKNTEVVFSLPKKMYKNNTQYFFKEKQSPKRSSMVHEKRMQASKQKKKTNDTVKKQKQKEKEKEQRQLTEKKDLEKKKRLAEKEKIKKEKEVKRLQRIEEKKALREKKLAEKEQLRKEKEKERQKKLQQQKKQQEKRALEKEQLRKQKEKEELRLAEEKQKAREAQLAEKQRLREEKEKEERRLAEEKQKAREAQLAEKQRLREGKEKEERRLAEEKQKVREAQLAEKQRLKEEIEQERNLKVEKEASKKQTPQAQQKPIQPQQREQIPQDRENVRREKEEKQKEKETERLRIVELKRAEKEKRQAEKEQLRKQKEMEKKRQAEKKRLNKIEDETKKKTPKNQKLTPSEINTPLSLQEVEKQISVSNLKQQVFEREGIIEVDFWEEVEIYPLIQPFSYAYIVKNTETHEQRYFLLEPVLDEKEKKHLEFIKETLLTYTVDTTQLEKSKEDVLTNQISQIVTDYRLDITPISQAVITYVLQKNLLGFERLEPLMKDKAIEDISCDGSGIPIFIYHRIHGSIQSNVFFEDEDVLYAFVMKLAQKCGKHISIAHPMLDATMPDGSRIQMTLSTEVSTKGSTFTIRKFRDEPYSPTDLIQFNTMSSEMMAYLWLAVEHGINTLIAGGTASGKTSTLNAISLFIPREAKIVSIEETREINLPHPNWIPGVARTGFGDVVQGKLTGEIDLYDLMKAALRQRPEFILVGEIRGREAYVLFQAMATGHATYSTVHADSSKSLIHRLEGEPINIPRIMLQSLDIVCMQTIARVKNKRARRCKQIIEIIDIDPVTKEILTNEVFRWDPVTDMFEYTGKSYVLEKIRNETNKTKEEMIEEMKTRAKLLDSMMIKHIHTFDDVAQTTARYYEHPQVVLHDLTGAKTA